MVKKIINVVFSILSVFLVPLLIKTEYQYDEVDLIPVDIPEVIVEAKPQETKILISAIGDCTLGKDKDFSYKGSINEYVDNNPYTYFFDGVKDVINNDDITIMNLESTFTESDIDEGDLYNFKAPYSYVNIITQNSIEIVNIANNHMHDYKQVGYEDTKKTLSNANVKYFGYDDVSVLEKDGIKIGFIGTTCFTESKCKNHLKNGIKYMNDNNIDTYIVSYHWGIEKEYNQNSFQTKMGRYAIDSGAELVIGHHPHVLQGIEQYNNKYIVYSLANFVFGGNRSPYDKDSMIFQLEITYDKNKEIISTKPIIIPVYVTGLAKRNNYQPIILSGDEKNRVIKKINKNSVNFVYNIE